MSLRSSLATWFNFYNGYDPLFMWWTASPTKHVNTALQEYAAFLREKVAPADQTNGRHPARCAVIAPAPAPKIQEVPDLQELLRLAAR